MRKTLIIAAVLLSQDADAQSDEYEKSANYYLPICQRFLINNPSDNNSVSTYEQGMCVGLVHGLAYMSGSCFPKGVTRGQTIRVVIAYIERHPQRMHEDFRELALEALHEAWPCD
jgi:hypothetical protein